MKKGQIYEGTVQRVEFPNKGYVVSEEGTAVVKNVIPGQTIRYAVTKKRGDRCEGLLLETLSPSPMEDQLNRCPYFGVCGGCTYQNVHYEDQLQIKEKQVHKIIDGVCKDYDFLGIVGSPVIEEYRNKMEFSFGDEYKDGPLALGMHKRGSFHDIVSTPLCKIVDEDFRQILQTTLTYFTEVGYPFYHKMRHTGYLRHLLVRKGKKTGEIMVDLVTSTQLNPDLTPYVERLKSLNLLGSLVSILNTQNDSLSDTVTNDGTEILYGRDYIFEEILGLKFKITPFSFFQTNSLGAEVLYEHTREFVGEFANKTIFDLYSGTGTIAQMLAAVATKVVGVEIVEEAVVAARDNAIRNGLDNCEFIAGDVLKVVNDLTDKPDIIILDPPRDGIHPKAIEHIIGFGVDCLVYVSCKPTSLARDIEIFEARGYKVEKVLCVDMFPGTVHVESVVLLSQQKPSDRIAVDLDLDELDVTSAEMKATYAEIKDYVLKEHGLKVTNLYISQVKSKCGLEIGENYNLAKSEDAKQPNCPEEKEKAILEALEHFGMVS